MNGQKLVLALVLGCLCMALVGAMAARPASAFATDDPEYEPDQVVIKLAPLPGVRIWLINRLYGTTTIGRLYGRTDTFLLQTPAGVDAQTLVALMADDLRLLYAELNYITRTPEDGGTDRIYAWGGFDDEPRYDQDAATLVGLTGADAYSLGDGVTVAVIDTGVQLDHPALAANLSPLGYDFVDQDLAPNDEANGVDDDGDGVIDELYGHGTHTAGIVNLVAPNAQLLPLRVLNSDGRGNTFLTASAVLYAALNGSTVINMSLGTDVNTLLLNDVVEQAAGLGVVMVAAAGNLSNDVRQYPAAHSCAAAVTSIDPYKVKSTFANYGDWVDLVAPGESIYSTYPEDGYAWGTGTSMSTPFAAGQAALLRSVDPSMTLDQVGELMGGTAELLDTYNPGYEGLLGKGLIRILTSLEYQAAGNWPGLEYNVFAGCNT